MGENANIPIVIGSPLNANDPYLGIFYDSANLSVNFRAYNGLEDIPADLASYVISLPAHLHDVSSKLAEVSAGTVPLADQLKCPTVTLPAHLRNITVINSTTAGTQLSTKLYNGVIKPLLSAFQLHHIYIETAGPDTVRDEARKVASGSTVIFLSGDTSLHELINALVERDADAPLYTAVIPTGTGNALASSIGHKDIPSAITSLFRGSPKPLSAFRVEFPERSYLYDSQGGDNKPLPINSTSILALVVASWAFHASLVADSDTPQYRKLGRQRFAEAANDNIARDQLYRAEITSRGKALVPAVDHSYLLFTTVTNLEPTFCISPHGAPPDDTRIHMVEIPYVPGPELLEIMMKVYDQSKHIADDRVNYLPVSAEGDEPAVEIELLDQTDSDDHIMRWCVDGQIIHCNTRPGARVRIFRPKNEFNGWRLYILV